MDLALAPIRTMEPAIVDRLRLVFPEKTFSIDRVPSVLTIKEFERVVQRAPFIGLAWMGLTPDRRNSRELQAAWQWRIVLIYKAKGDLDRRFKGDAQGLGLDPMVDLSVALLQGAKIPGIGNCQVTRAEAVYAEGWEDADTVIAQVDFEISTTISPAAFQLKTAADFTRLGIAWLTSDSADPAIPQADITIGEPA